jgi:hypothetical protein
MTVQKNQGLSGKKYFRHQDAENKRKPDRISPETTDGAIIISAGGNKDFVAEKNMMAAIRYQWKNDLPDGVDGTTLIRHYQAQKEKTTSRLSCLTDTRRC